MMSRVGVVGLIAGLFLVGCHVAAEPFAPVVVVTGEGECSDCESNGVHPAHAFSGLGVSIECKAAKGGLKRRGSGRLDAQGKFNITLAPQGEECYAQLEEASGTPCSSKQLLMEEQGSLRPSGKLSFSSQTCASAFLWFHKHKLPLFPWHKKKGFFPPIYKKPSPSPSLPAPAPVYPKPHPPTKPLPTYKKKPFPLHKFPLIFKKKPLPHFPPFFKKKPLPFVPPHP